jgi:hypothetical protein
MPIPPGQPITSKRKPGCIKHWQKLSITEKKNVY